MSWIVSNGGYMSDELNLPYAPSKLTHQCPHDVLVPDMPGVRVTGEIVGKDDEDYKHNVLLSPSL